MPNDAATTRLLVWDDRDMRACLASVLVTTPARTPEVDLEAVYLWLAARCRDGEQADACLFTTIEPGTEADAARRVTDVRTKGFAVVARPARNAVGSLSSSLRAYLDRAASDAGLAEVVVASHDGAALRDRLEELAGSGVAVTVLGFRERAGFAADSDALDFVDIEEVAAAFPFPLPRTNLYDLPDDGLALPPLRRPAPGGSQDVPPAPVTPAPAAPAGETTAGPPPSTGPAGSSTGSSSPAVATSSIVVERSALDAGSTASLPEDAAAGSASADAAGPADAAGADTAGSPPWAAGASPGASRSSSIGLFSRPPADSADAGDVPPPPPPPPPAPASIGALDDLLAGVQASPLTPPATRPGRVSPPANGTDDRTDHQD